MVVDKSYFHAEVESFASSNLQIPRMLNIKWKSKFESSLSVKLLICWPHSPVIRLPPFKLVQLRGSWIDEFTVHILMPPAWRPGAAVRRFGPFWWRMKHVDTIQLPVRECFDFGFVASGLIMKELWICGNGFGSRVKCPLMFQFDPAPSPYTNALSPLALALCHPTVCCRQWCLLAYVRAHDAYRSRISADGI